jgi:hypothetical protein
MPITFDEISADIRPETPERPEAAIERAPAPDLAERHEWLDQELRLREQRRARLCDQ